jgi:pimeloyl-ACP methyl ester carboxylesterase
MNAAVLQIPHAVTAIEPSYHLQGVLTSEFFLNEKKFLHGIDGRPNPERMSHFGEALARARELAKVRQKTNPNDGEALLPWRWLQEWNQTPNRSAEETYERLDVDAYPKWQARMREKQPRLLVIWGKYESSFDPPEPEAYHRDVPNAEVHIVDGGHFALDTAPDEIAQLVLGFMSRESSAAA